MNAAYDHNKLVPMLPEIDGYDWQDRSLIEVKHRPTVHIDDDGFILISAEDGKGFADYYGEFAYGYPWIHPALEEFAQVRGLYWEWVNPGCIILAE